MRSIAISLLLILALAFTGCGGDDPGSPDGTTGQVPLAEGTIGASGGELISNDVILTVPAGALSGDKDLGIFDDNLPHPMGDSWSPNYRLEGLPQQLGAPLVLRFRHTGGQDDTLNVFLGEERVSKTGGEGLSWETVAYRDSSGWCIVELPRGPYDLGSKTNPVLYTTAVSGVYRMTTIPDHFEAVYSKPEVSDQQMEMLLNMMEFAYSAIYDLGFHFGDQNEIWPLEVLIREPENTIAEYISGPHAKGHFNISPTLLDSPILPHVLTHEVFHCAQDFYDYRPPEEWVTLNEERLWLDEATAVRVERYSGGPDYITLGVNFDNYLAPLAGVAGHPDLETRNFGYGMSTFIEYLTDNQEISRIHELYTAFPAHRNVVDCLQEVIDPPLSTWCLDFQRKLVTVDIVPIYAPGEMWNRVPMHSRIVPESGATIAQTVTVPDFGSYIHKVYFWESPSKVPTALKVQAAAGVDLAVYARLDFQNPILVITGTESLVLSRFDELVEVSDEIIVQLTHSSATSENWDGQLAVDLEIKVIDDFGPSDFEFASVSAQFQATWDTGGNPYGSLYMDGREGTWNGSTFTAEWDSLAGADWRDWGRIEINLDPETLDILSWFAESNSEGYSSDYSAHYEIQGSEVQLTSQGEYSLEYDLRGASTCNSIANIEVKVQGSAVTDRELLNFSCDSESYLEIEFQDYH
jgi:hypothetical protein